MEDRGLCCDGCGTDGHCRLDVVPVPMWEGPVVKEALKLLRMCFECCETLTGEERACLVAPELPWYGRLRMPVHY